MVVAGNLTNLFQSTSGFYKVIHLFCLHLNLHSTWIKRLLLNMEDDNAPVWSKWLSILLQAVDNDFCDNKSRRVLDTSRWDIPRLRWRLHGWQSRKEMTRRGLEGWWEQLLEIGRATQSLNPFQVGMEEEWAGGQTGESTNIHIGHGSTRIFINYYQNESRSNSFFYSHRCGAYWLRMKLCDQNSYYIYDENGRAH